MTIDLGLGVFDDNLQSTGLHGEAIDLDVAGSRPSAGNARVQVHDRLRSTRAVSHRITRRVVT